MKDVQTNQLGRKLNILILGASGQTGSYLAEILESNLENVVFSASRSPNSFFTPKNYLPLSSDLSLYSLCKILEEVKADVVVNMISLSSVFECDQNPSLSEAINRNFVEDLTEAVLVTQEKLRKQILLFQCSSSEMYSNLEPHTLISEDTQLNPGTLYGKHKAEALEFLRKTSAVNADFLYSTGIFFNHESPRRSSSFVSKKIASGVREISKGKLQTLELGDVTVLRDWSFARDFAQGIAEMVNLRQTGEFIFASGELHSIDEFCEQSFHFFGIDNYKDFVRINPNFVRKNNSNGLLGDASKLRAEIRWQPTVDFEELVKLMCAEPE
jgi:GDPmannose 4,6-dehydratase